MKEFAFPLMFDDKLWFLMDCREDGILSKHYILGSGDTFPGRVCAWCEERGNVFNVSLYEMKELSPEAEYWMKGFLAGNTEDYPIAEDDEDGYPIDNPKSKRHSEYVKLYNDHISKIRRFYQKGIWPSEDDE